MSTTLRRCAFCGDPFHPDRYNSHHQECCTRSHCVRARKRKRQREWQARRRATDPEFRKRGNARCAAANRRRRAARRARAGPEEPEVPAVELSHVVAGLVSQLTDTSDPVQLRACLKRYEVRGQRVALLAGAGPDPP